MAETKKTMRLLGQDKIVTEVPVVRSTEAWSEYELEDGSVLRYKTVATSIIRIDGEYNPDGTPIYLLMPAPVIYAVSVPDTLRKPS
jgi:hypothetical protein